MTIIKPEPLQDKDRCYNGYHNEIEEYYLPEDIRSAVEWLKEEYRTRSLSRNEVIKLIDKAFNDVMKDE